MTLSVTLGGLRLKNPVMPASGTFGFGYEMARFFDLNKLGAVVLKGTTLEPRLGNPQPRIAECREGMLNAIGLQNPGAHAVAREELPRLAAAYGGPVIANVSGFGVEEYARAAAILDPYVDMLEINVSCPNVKHGGMAFGTTEKGAAEVVRAVKAVAAKPVYMKLTPNVTSVAAIARACQDAGADGLTLINTLLGMVIDPRTGRPLVSTKAAGFSGPAIKPVAVRCVYEAYQAVSIPIIGVGGVATAEDVIEMLSAGARAVQVGSQTLTDPWACERIIDALPETLAGYGIDTIENCIGRAHA